MSAPDSPIPALDAAALNWLLERQDGFSPERAEAFSAWLAADPRHRAALARLERSHDILVSLPDFRDEIEAAFPRATSAANPARPAFRTWLALGGLAAALALGVFGWSRFSGQVLEPRYATAADARQTVALPDGTVVELNTATAVRIRFSKTERRVELESGEAHFAVARDSARPFIVHAGAINVRAVGTVFNVRHAAAAVEVVVVEGQVEVQPTPDVHESAAPAPAAAPAAPRLQAGERILVPSDAAAPAPRIEPLDADAIRDTLRWQPSLVEFDDEPLRDIVVRFNRRNRLQLVLAAPTLGDRRLAGVFALDQAEAFARLLERDGDIIAEHRSDHQIILRPRR